MRSHQTTTQLYKTIVDSIPYATGLFDNQLRYVYYNKAGEQMSGVPLEKAIGKRPEEVLPPSVCSKFIPLLSKSVLQKKPVSDRVEINFHGEDILLSVDYIPVLNDEDEIDFVIGITENSTEIENKRSEAMANARLSSLGHLAANVTHEINNPLQLIQLRLKRLEEMIATEPNNTMAMLQEIDRINNTTEKITKIVNSVRRQTRKSDPNNLEQVFISELVEEAISYSRHRIESAKAELILDFKNDSKLKCNPIEMEQVLINLITNACDALSKADKRWVKISSFKRDERIIIRVQDSGPGIPPEIQNNIMKPFFTTKEIHKGTGIGLNLSRTLVKRNNGTLSFIPKEEFTTFEIQFS